MQQQSLADVLFAVVIILALAWWHAAAHTAIIAATVAYLGVAAIRSAANSETVRDTMMHRQAQVTERYRIRQATPRVLATEIPQIAYSPPTPQLPGSTFVAPVDVSTAKDAVLWCLSLYGPDGQPDPHKVNLKGDKEAPGRLKVAGPSNAAKEWLLTKRVLERVDHGLRLRTSRFPTVDHVRGLLS